MNFGERLKCLRENSRMTQQEFASLFELQTYTIQFWETTSRPGFLEAICEIANYFNITVDYLLGNTDNKYRTKEETESVLIEKETKILEKLEICKTEIKELNEMIEEALFLFNMRN